MRTSGTKSHIHMPAHKHTTLLHFFLFLTYFHSEGLSLTSQVFRVNFLGLSNWMFTCGPEKWHPLKPCDASLCGTCMCCFLKCKFIFVTVLHREYVCTCIFEQDKKKERRCQVKYVCDHYMRSCDFRGRQSLTQFLQSWQISNGHRQNLKRCSKKPLFCWPGTGFFDCQENLKLSFWADASRC